MTPLSRSPRGVLLDLDGTLYEDDREIPGASQAVAALRARGLPLRFVTNTTRASRAALAARLGRLGLGASANELFTAPMAAAAWLRREGVRRVALCLPRLAVEEFSAFEIVDTRPEAVVVGDLGDDWTFARLNQAFLWISEGACLVALHRNRFWKTGGQLRLDAGAYVAALEYATGTTAALVGKPSAPMFEAAAASMQFAPSDVAVVGDDLIGDVGGAQAVGAVGILVKTGKFRAGDLERSTVTPDLVLDSIADLPAALGARLDAH